MILRFKEDFRISEKKGEKEGRPKKPPPPLVCIDIHL